MTGAETEREMVERHIAAGERHVAHQREIVAFLHLHGYPTVQADQLLDLLTDMLELHRQHLARLQVPPGAGIY